MRQLAKDYDGLRFVILGGAEDRPLGEVIARAAPDHSLDLTGQTSLPEMVEWLRLSELMVTNDTRPMHIAAALGRPVVAMLGPTEPCRTGPYGQLQHVVQLDLPCVPCMKPYCTQAKPVECLTGISPAVIFERVRKELDSAAGRPPARPQNAGFCCCHSGEPT